MKGVTPMAQIETNHHHHQEKFYFDRKNYFHRFLTDVETKFDFVLDSDRIKSFEKPISRNIRHALEYFVNDLRHDRNQTIERFLQESDAENILRIIGQLLLSNDDRICGNSAYILGSTVEVDTGLKRFLMVFSNQRSTSTVNIIRILCHLLAHSDSECVLNAAGTLGTICSSKDGRDLILQHTCIPQLIINTAALLSSNNSWIASNAALVLARITVEELGCQAVLTHSKHREILNQLMMALDVRDPSRSTNAAFAIGRLIEGNEGKKTLISTCGQDRLFDALSSMLEAHEEKGVNKNACYALSCLCTTAYGFQLCLQSLTTFHRILSAIEKILASIEHETVWFALMCLRTIAQYEGATEHLCYSNKLPEKLKEIRDKWLKYADIQEEAKALWYIIHRNVKPDRAKIDECRTTSAQISWNLSVNTWNDDDIQFRVILDNVSLALINEKHYSLKDLKSNTDYIVQIQYVTTYGDSVCSDPVSFRTDDELPPCVNNLHVVRTTMTAARFSWDAPNLDGCESFKGYQVYLNDAEHELVTECGITIGSLTASTTYQVDVCAVTNKGKGPRTSIDVTTASAGDSLPAPPTFSVIGRREIHVKWQPPESICGRLTRYELLSNGKCIYSGTDQEYRAIMLKSDTEYSMEVVVITNEGRFRGRPAKARTLKDEYNVSHRHSLYEPPTQVQPKVKRIETIHSTNPIPSHHKVTVSNERRTAREVTPAPPRKVDITTVRALQLRSQHAMKNRLITTIPPQKPVTLTRSNTIGSSGVTFRRTKTDVHISPPARVSATVIIPTLDIEREHPGRWATAASQRNIMRPQPYRLSMAATPGSVTSGTKEIKRCTSTSLPDLYIK